MSQKGDDMTSPEERVAHRMREARERLGLSQEQVAHRLGVTLRTYARWERGETYGFIGRIAETAKALETTSNELLGGEQLTTPTVEELSDKLDTVIELLESVLNDKAKKGSRPR